MNALRELLLTLDEVTVLALNAYFEARSEYRKLGQVAYVAVTVVALNRAYHPHEWADTVQGVITAPWQFSWTNDIDPQYSRALKMAQNFEGDYGAEWEAALDAAKQTLSRLVANPVGNATYYYNPHVCSPPWADAFIETAVIGNHRFMADPDDADYLWETPPAVTTEGMVA